jgi:hypothetical protein
MGRAPQPDRRPAQQRPGRRFRPRYARITALGGALAVTAVALLGSAGWLPADTPTRLTADRTHARPAAVPSPNPAPATREHDPGPAAPPSRKQSPSDATRTAPDPLPAASGTGKRVVFDMSAQRVWLVDPSRPQQVLRSYLVSGSLSDNLHPGSYTVYSRSRHAIGVDDSGTMQYMVRFAHGEHAAIGFHDVPVKDGHLVQSRSDLGTPQSHGCIRQWRPDARALWAFAPVGTSVVVVA